MYGLAVNLIVSVSGHYWIINEIRMFFSKKIKKKKFWKKIRFFFLGHTMSTCNVGYLTDRSLDVLYLCRQVGR